MSAAALGISRRERPAALSRPTITIRKVEDFLWQMKTAVGGAWDNYGSTKQREEAEPAPLPSLSPSLFPLVWRRLIDDDSHLLCRTALFELYRHAVRFLEKIS